MRVAHHEAKDRHPERDAVCFHCQQAAEKYLKSLLSELGRHIPRTHDIQRLLLDLLHHYPALAPFRRFSVSLSGFAVDYRYPGRSASTREMRAALRHAERVRAEVRTILGLQS